MAFIVIHHSPSKNAWNRFSLSFIIVTRMPITGINTYITRPLEDTMSKHSITADETQFYSYLDECSLTNKKTKEEFHNRIGYNQKINDCCLQYMTFPNHNHGQYVLISNILMQQLLRIAIHYVK